MGLPFESFAVSLCIVLLKSLYTSLEPQLINYEAIYMFFKIKYLLMCRRGSLNNFKVLNSVFQPFCCSGTFRKCLRCSLMIQASILVFILNQIIRWVDMSHLCLFLSSGGTMSFRGTPVEKHWCRQKKIRIK